jgi:hypothetical protein
MALNSQRIESYRVPKFPSQKTDSGFPCFMGVRACRVRHVPGRATEFPQDKLNILLLQSLLHAEGFPTSTKLHQTPLAFGRDIVWVFRVPPLRCLVPPRLRDCLCLHQPRSMTTVHCWVSGGGTAPRGWVQPPLTSPMISL